MYIGTMVNESPTIVGKASAEITGGSFLAAKFDVNGGIVLAGAGENAIGILLADTPEDVAVGDNVTAQIKDIGLWKVGAAVNPGDELTSDSNGKAVKAVAGNFITAVALEKATAADQIIKVQIVKSGYKPA